MLFLNCIPAAEIFDRGQLHLQVKSICMLFQDRLINRSVVILSDQLLSFIGIQIFQICFRSFCIIMRFFTFSSTTATDGCARILMTRRYDLVIIRIIPYRKKRFIFPRRSAHPPARFPRKRLWHLLHRNPEPGHFYKAS